MCSLITTLLHIYYHHRANPINLARLQKGHIHTLTGANSTLVNSMSTLFPSVHKCNVCAMGHVCAYVCAVTNVGHAVCTCATGLSGMLGSLGCIHMQGGGLVVGLTKQTTPRDGDFDNTHGLSVFLK